MPKVRGLTRQQREKAEVRRVSDDILEVIRTKRGQEEKSFMQVAEDVGLTRDQYQRWRANGIGSARVEKAVIAAYRSGYRLELVPIKGG
ncbi:MAG: hypothetical protein HFG26_09030 [Provencibacterium sp.]|jgi:hypothetical protein|nr:hypothetical protein [Provencibacterium sp.]